MADCHEWKMCLSKFFHKICLEGRDVLFKNKISVWNIMHARLDIVALNPWVGNTEMTPRVCHTLLGRMDIDITLVEDCRRLAKQCKMNALIEELQKKCKQVYEFGEKVLLNCVHNFLNIHLPSTHIVPHTYLFISRALVSNKPGVCVKVLSLESNSCRLQEDMAQLADCAMPPDLRVRKEIMT